MTPGGFPDNQGKSPDYSALGNERRHLWQATMNIAGDRGREMYHNRLQPGVAWHVPGPVLDMGYDARGNRAGQLLV